MPTLDAEYLERMRKYRGHCELCGKEVKRNYCRQCDEFFETGHTCKIMSQYEEKHQGHRTY